MLCGSGQQATYSLQQQLRPWNSHASLNEDTDNRGQHFYSDPCRAILAVLEMGNTLLVVIGVEKYQHVLLSVRGNRNIPFSCKRDYWIMLIFVALDFTDDELI
jgi:hypothetical protein